jgi:hypothetical protein
MAVPSRARLAEPAVMPVIGGVSSPPVPMAAARVRLLFIPRPPANFDPLSSLRRYQLGRNRDHALEIFARGRRVRGFDY